MPDDLNMFGHPPKRVYAAHCDHRTKTPAGSPPAADIHPRLHNLALRYTGNQKEIGVPGFGTSRDAYDLTGSYDCCAESCSDPHRISTSRRLP